MLGVVVPKNYSTKCLNVPCFCISLYFQAAVIQSAAACRAPRRSCCLKVGAWWETPRETLGATRAMRTWRMVMMALLSLDHQDPRLRPSPPSPFSCVGLRLCSISCHFCNTSPISLLWTNAFQSNLSCCCHIFPSNLTWTF